MLHKRRFILRGVQCLLILWFLGAVSISIQVYAEPGAPTDTPIPVVTENFNEWTLNEGLLYWADRCYGGEFRGPGYLRRKPANGGTTRTLSTVTNDTCYTFMNLTANADGLYYYSVDGGGIYFRPVDNPYDPPTLVRTLTTANAPVGAREMAVDGDYIYWMVDTLSGTDTIRRARTDGTGSIQTVVASAPNPDDLAVVDGVVYWLDDDGLWSTNTSSCTTLPCDKTRLVTTRGTYLMYHDPDSLFVAYQLYWVTLADPIETIPSHIWRRSCVWQFNPYPNPPSLVCTNADLYTAADTGWTLGDLTTDGTHLFWTERRDPLDPNPDGKLRRMPIGGGTADDIAVNMPNIDARVFSDAWYVYFGQYAGSNIGIFKLPFNASAIVRDLAAHELEVTQGIQNLANDVPLIARKPTYVRGYAREISGPDAVSVEAWLYGTRGASALPGSPLPAQNGVHPLATGNLYDRGALDESWLFQLPESWTTAGTINLRLVIDPREQYSDPNRANNEISENVTFDAKAPVCTVFVPVRTHSPNYNSPTDNPNFWQMYDVAKKLWPAYDFWSYEQSEDIAELQVCWKWGFIPYPCFGPYELPSDSWKVLTSLNVRDFFSNDPDSCDNANARTHYIGMVHPDTNTSTSSGWVLGTAYRNDNVAWVKFEPHSFVLSDAPALPDAGATLAHEMGHNLGRKHVDCGDPDNIDSGYPYPTDQISDVGQASYYGFDGRTQTVIAPDDAVDFMSYCRPYWTSDYTWRALNNRISSSSMVAAAPVINKLDAGDAVFVSGAVTPTANTGVLNYAWVYPTGSLSAGILRKWEGAAAFPLKMSGPTPQSTTAPSYTLQLRDAHNAILATYPVTLSETLNDPADPPVNNFSLTFVDPGNVAHVELLADSTVIDSRAPGNQVPTVTLSEPHGGETFTDTLDLIWQGADADEDDTLLYNVQYSPDDGVTWRAVVNDFPAPDSEEVVTLTLNTRGLPGSGVNQGRLRVAASDGYNTGMATSNGFTIPDHAPEAYIIPPPSAPAGALVLLRGGAMDAEDGALTGGALAWTVGGQAQGTGREVVAGGLGPGAHTATLTAQDSGGNMNVAQATFFVQFLRIPQDSAPQLDGFCDDAAYLDAPQLQLAPYESGGQATVRLLRTGDHLWACFSGLKAGAATPGAFAGLRFDADYSRDDLAQPTDYAFFVGEDGGYFTYAGNDSGGFAAAGPGGLQAFVSAYTYTWSAELRVEESVLGGWDHVAGMNVGHYWVASQGNDYVWPYASGWNHPDTWATTMLGQGPTVFLPLVLRQ